MSVLAVSPILCLMKGIDPVFQLQEEQHPLVTDTSSINAQLGDLEGGGGTEEQVRKRKDHNTITQIKLNIRSVKKRGERVTFW